jgi:hypothetical protein
LVVFAAAFAAWRLAQGDVRGSVFGVILVVGELAVAIQLVVLIRRRNRNR